MGDVTLAQDALPVSPAVTDEGKLRMFTICHVRICFSALAYILGVRYSF